MRFWLPLLLSFGCGDDADLERAADAGRPLDAGARDASMDARPELVTDPPSCLGTPRTFALGESAGRSFSALVIDDRVHLALVAPECTGATTEGQGEGVRYLNFHIASGDAGAPLDVDSDDCLPLREPTLLAHGDDALSLYVGSSRGARFDVYETSPSRPMRTWMRVTNDDAVEVSLAAAALGPMRMPWLAYTASRSASSREAAPIRLHGMDVWTTHHAASLAFERREDGLQQGRGVLGWVNDLPESAGAYVLPLSESGAASGMPIKIGEGGGTIAFASRAEGTGVFYGDPARYRALSDTPGPAVALGGQARALAAAPYRGGFALLSRDDVGLHARALDLEGRVLSEATLKRDARGRDVQLLSSARALIAVWDEPAADAGLARTLHVATVDCL